jgi:hypothetical protein
MEGYQQHLSRLFTYILEDIVDAVTSQKQDADTATCYDVINIQ